MSYGGKQKMMKFYVNNTSVHKSIKQLASYRLARWRLPDQTSSITSEEQLSSFFAEIAQKERHPAMRARGDQARKPLWDARFSVAAHRRHRGPMSLTSSQEIRIGQGKQARFIICRATFVCENYVFARRSL